ncbi:Hypothetical_protein [Hexamita inflata]|uniref:Hypothetical_protein n=1 Tax=Hexamita inflata TaxID=28002 RepID=A0AA86QC14_9EUKA|nr:Hypothetical protein HINF_LOCUS37927 [Hexamita inflata]
MNQQIQTVNQIMHYYICLIRESVLQNQSGEGYYCYGMLLFSETIVLISIQQPAVLYRFCVQIQLQYIQMSSQQQNESYQTTGLLSNKRSQSDLLVFEFQITSEYRMSLSKLKQLNLSMLSWNQFQIKYISKNTNDSTQSCILILAFGDVLAVDNQQRK